MSEILKTFPEKCPAAGGLLVDGEPPCTATNHRILLSLQQNQLARVLRLRWQSRCSPAGGMKRLLRTWLHGDDGQDLIEYALLGAAVALAGAVAFSFLGNAMSDTYELWDTAVQSDELVEIPDPAPSPSPSPAP